MVVDAVNSSVHIDIPGRLLKLTDLFSRPYCLYNNQF